MAHSRFGMNGEREVDAHKFFTQFHRRRLSFNLATSCEFIMRRTISLLCSRIESCLLLLLEFEIDFLRFSGSRRWRGWEKMKKWKRRKSNVKKRANNKKAGSFKLEQKFLFLLISGSRKSDERELSWCWLKLKGGCVHAGSIKLKPINKLVFFSLSFLKKFYRSPLILSEKLLYTAQWSFLASRARRPQSAHSSQPLLPYNLS